MRKKTLAVILCAAMLCTGCVENIQSDNSGSSSQTEVSTSSSSSSAGALSYSSSNKTSSSVSSNELGSSTSSKSSSSSSSKSSSSSSSKSSSSSSSKSNSSSSSKASSSTSSKASSSSSSKSSYSSSSKSSSSTSSSSSAPAVEIIGPYNQRAQTAEEKAFCGEVFKLINEIRKKNGLAEFKQLSKLDEIAVQRAWENTVKYGHTRPDGTSCFTAIDESGLLYSSCAENVAAGYSTPAKVVDGWMNSEGHRKNILNPQLEYLGVGFYHVNGGDGGYGYYWAQVFYTPWNW